MEIIDFGYEAIITCVDTEKLDRSFVGWRFDYQLLPGLPASVCACGENGKFHVVVIDGSMFSGCPQVEAGEVIAHSMFVFAAVILREMQDVDG